VGAYLQQHREVLLLLDLALSLLLLLSWISSSLQAPLLLLVFSNPWRRHRVQKEGTKSWGGSFLPAVHSGAMWCSKRIMFACVLLHAEASSFSSSSSSSSSFSRSFSTHLTPSAACAKCIVPATAIARQKLNCAVQRGKHSDGYVYAISGIDPQLWKGRTVRVMKETRPVHMNGPGLHYGWRLVFDVKEKWANPLMGWTSGRDPLAQLVYQLKFDTKEQAVRYCEEHNVDYTVEEETVMTEDMIEQKSYADNFQWDGDDETDATGHSMWATRRLGCK